MKEDYVNTVLRKDGTVITITPANGHYELIVEGGESRRVRTVDPELAADPLNAPDFEAIVQELKRLDAEHHHRAG